VADTGIFKISHQVWQRANIAAATAYFREVLAREPDNARVKGLYEGLLDVVDPTRRVMRQQRALATATRLAQQERRRRAEHRRSGDRRQRADGAPGGLERRSGVDRRTAHDRRKR
jgi:hypothetical protein